MLRKLKNITDKKVIVSVQGFNINTEFLSFEPNEEIWVTEKQYKFFLGLEKNSEGFYVDKAQLVLSPSFQIVGVDFADSAKILTATFTADEAEVTVPHESVSADIDVIVTDEFANDFEIKSIDATNVVIAKKEGTLVTDATVQVVIIK